MREQTQGLIDSLNSPLVAVDDKHYPRVYAQILSGHLITPAGRAETSPDVMKKGSISCLTERIHTSGRENVTGVGNHTSHMTPSTSSPSSNSPLPPQIDGSTQGTYYASSGTTEDSPVQMDYGADVVGDDQTMQNALQMPFSSQQLDYLSPLGLDHDFLQSLNSMGDNSLRKNIAGTLAM